MTRCFLLQCVVCLSSKATMQTFPCAHRVVCRKCFVKTIQVCSAHLVSVGVCGFSIKIKSGLLYLAFPVVKTSILSNFSFKFPLLIRLPSLSVVCH